MKITLSLTLALFVIIFVPYTSISVVNPCTCVQIERKNGECFPCRLQSRVYSDHLTLLRANYKASEMTSRYLLTTVKQSSSSPHIFPVGKQLARFIASVRDRLRQEETTAEVTVKTWNVTIPSQAPTSASPTHLVKMRWTIKKG